MADSYFFTPAILASNQALATSLTDISGFSQTVVPGATYRFEVFMNFTTVGTTVTVGLSMGGTLTESISAYEVNIQTAAAGTRISQLYTAIPGAATATGAIATAGTFSATIRGFVKCNTAGGTLTVQGIRGGATSATALAGSIFTLEQVN